MRSPPPDPLVAAALPAANPVEEEPVLLPMYIFEIRRRQLL
jgi:hypothetical protein